jgi:hypothetical protein
VTAITPSTTIGDAATPIELGHPVRSFTLVMVGFAVLLLALQWTGAVHPNLESPGSSTTSYGPFEIAMVEVHNAGALPVRVDRATWPTIGVRTAALGLAPEGWNDPEGSLDLAHIPPFRPFTIDANASRWLVVTVLPECGGQLGEPTVRVRTALGLHRTVDLRPDQAEPALTDC